MPLKLRVKPEGKIFVTGTGWLKNAGNRPIDVVIEDGILVDREKRREQAIAKLKEPTETEKP